jgi:hypothetical protein
MKLAIKVLVSSSGCRVQLLLSASWGIIFSDVHQA